jgi:flagellar basal body P-ring formation protein FlgA
MKPLRSFTALLAFALSAGCAFATPVLRADIAVTGAVVTVGDMFDDAGLLAERPLFRAPLPGTAGNVDVSSIRAATARVGLADFETLGLLSVRVARDATPVTEETLADLIVADLASRGILGEGMSADTLFSNPIGIINAAIEGEPAHLDNLRYLPGNGTFSARFSVAGMTTPIDVTGTIELSIEAPHLAAALPAGTVLRPDHIVMRPLPLRQADAQRLPSLDQLVGMALNRQTREGMLLRTTDVSVPQTVAKNDLVTIYYRQGPMTLTVKGQAVTGAAEGAPLQVLNMVSRRVISATAIAPGAVEVSAAPLALAGL